MILLGRLVSEPESRGKMDIASLLIAYGLLALGALAMLGLHTIIF